MRISRQQLQSSSSRTAATVAAAAAEEAEAARRSLDRVHELCWQTIERGLRSGAAMFSCTAGALAMNGWPDERDVLGAETSNEGLFFKRQGRSTSRETFERSTQRFYGRNLSSAVDPRCWCL